SSVIAWRRKTTEAVEIGGVSVPMDANLLLLLGSANRDPAVFENPEHFDIHRQNAKEHLSLGFGAHYCLGAPLARLEARIVLEELSARLPSLHLIPGQTLRDQPQPGQRRWGHLRHRLRAADDRQMGRPGEGTARRATHRVCAPATFRCGAAGASTIGHFGYPRRRARR